MVTKELINVDDLVGALDSEILNVQAIDGFAFHIICSGSMTVTAALYGSCQHKDRADFVPFMTLITGSSSTIAAGASLIIDAFVQKYRYAQIKLTAASGTGNIEVWYNGKQN